MNEERTLLFRQLFEQESSTYTYILADAETMQGFIIDPVWETLERDLKDLQELGIDLKYSMETHVHADHITSVDKIRQATQAQAVIGKNSGVKCADIYMDDNESVSCGGLNIKALYTPGHTDGCSSYLVEDLVFTGDALFVRGCGRTDFQSGSAQRLFHSVHQKLFTLPNETFVYPAHDYRGHTVSTIGEEKKYNPRLKLDVSEEEFIKIMDSLKLANPKKIMEALPANMACGRMPEDNSS